MMHILEEKPILYTHLILTLARKGANNQRTILYLIGKEQNR